MTIGLDEINAALDELLEELEAIGPPDGTPAPVEAWLRARGFDSDSVRHAAVAACVPVPEENRLEAMTAWMDGFTIGVVLGRGTK